MSSLVVHGFSNYQNADESTPLVPDNMRKKTNWYVITGCPSSIELRSRYR